MLSIHAIAASVISVRTKFYGLAFLGSLACALVYGVYYWIFQRHKFDGKVLAKLAEHLGLAYEKSSWARGEYAYGLLPDGRCIRLYDDLKKNGMKFVNPWASAFRYTLNIEVGIESDSWEQLDAHFRDEARQYMRRHFQLARDRQSGDLLRLGFSDVSLSGEMVVVQSKNLRPSEDILIDLLKVMGRIASDTEKGCLEQIRTGRKPQPTATLPLVTSDTSPAQAASVVAVDASQDQPWTCEACQALNPQDQRRCQMCAVPRQPAAAS